jgi:apolipoprotein N-acyltransferase
VLKLLLNAIARPDIALPRFLAVVTGALLLIAFPKFDLGFLTWFALIPLFYATRGRSVREGFWLGWLAGFVFFFFVFNWIWHVTSAGWPALEEILAVLTWIWGQAVVALLAGYLAIYFGAWGAAVAAATRRFGSGSIGANLAIMFLLSAAWVAQEWLRGWVITGFPWNKLGDSQHANSGAALGLAQIADITGVYGISFILCIFNLGIVLTVEKFRRDRGFGRRPHIELFVAIGLVLLAWQYGMRAVMQHRPGGEPLTVTLIQPNIPQEVKEDKALADFSRKQLRDLTETAIAHTKPQLILWPETATPDYFRWDKECFQTISNVVKRTGAYLLTGSMDLDGHENPKTARSYNAAFLVQPNLRIQKPYWKMHLVPFGEYVPLERWLPFMKYLTPIPGSFDHGTDYTLQRLDSPPVSIAPLICFEDTFAYLPRNFVRRGATLLVNVTNDGWFKESAGAYQHAACAVFRAIETRTPMIRCANNGLSGYVDTLGRIVDYIHGGPKDDIFITGWKTLTIPVTPAGAARSLTFYVRYGDVFAFACIGLTLLWAMGEIFASYARRHHQSHQGAR